MTEKLSQRRTLILEHDRKYSQRQTLFIDHDRIYIFFFHLQWLMFVIVNFWVMFTKFRSYSLGHLGLVFQYILK